MKTNVLQRIELIDAVRGLALLGLLLVHMAEYFELYWMKPSPTTTTTIIFSLFAGKSFAVFALLFGANIQMVLYKKAEQGIDFTKRFFWRLMLLGIMGYVHGVIYSVDILQVLAIAGMAALLVSRVGNTLLLILAALFLFQLPNLIVLTFTIFDPSNISQQPLHWSVMPPSLAVFAQGSFTEVIAENTFTGQYGKWLLMLESGRFSNIIGLILIGIWLGRIFFLRKS